MSEKPCSKIQLFQYSLLALPLAFAGLPLYIHAPDFYTRDLGLNIGLIGVILLVVRLVDAFQDPLIGYISDKNAHKRFMIVFAGVVMLIAGMAGVFYGPQFGVPVGVWFALNMVLATSGFSVVTINLNMIGGFLHGSPTERTRIASWREAFGLVGLLIASVLPAALQTIKPAEEAFRGLFWVFGAVMVLGFVMFSRFMSRISPGHMITTSQSQKGFSFLSILMGPDRGFFGVCFLTHLASAMPGVMVLFFIRDYLGAESLSGLFLFLYFVSGAAFIGVWAKVASKFGKERAWLASMVLAVLTFAWAFALDPGDVFAYGVICVLSGTVLGADLALPASILADRVTVQKSESEATQYYALLAFIPKTAIAIASGVSFLILGYLGFEAGAANSPQVLQGVLLLYGVVPCVIKLGAAYSLWCLYKREGKNYANLRKGSADGTYDFT